MSYHAIHATSTITVRDCQTLVQVLVDYGPQAQTLIGAIIVKEPLTKAQLRRLPPELRRKIQSTDDALAFLERLWSLDDLRP